MTAECGLPAECGHEFAMQSF